MKIAPAARQSIAMGTAYSIEKTCAQLYRQVQIPTWTDAAVRCPTAMGTACWTHADQCPDVAAGAKPDPARIGCPLADRDGDGVLDASDQCPVT